MAIMPSVGRKSRSSVSGSISPGGMLAAPPDASKVDGGLGGGAVGKGIATTLVMMALFGAELGCEML